MLKEGVIWRVGNGDSIRIWDDPWLPRGITRWPLTPRGQTILTMVSDLMDPITGNWDEELVKDTFCVEDEELVKPFYLCLLTLIWMT